MGISAVLGSWNPIHHLCSSTPPNDPFHSRKALSLRAKGTLNSEPRFSTPCNLRFFPRDTEKTGHFQANPLTMANFAVSHGKNRMSQRVENPGSLISAPLALRDVLQKALKLAKETPKGQISSLQALQKCCRELFS